MPSKIKTFTYMTKHGEEATTRLSGESERIVDIKFQQFLLKEMSADKKAKTKRTQTVESFITDIYLPSFTQKLHPTTLENYRAYGMISRSVTYPDRSKPHIGKRKSKSSERTILIASPLYDILQQYQEPCGYILGRDKPLCYYHFENCSSCVQSKGYS